jgi:3-(3-hydroxy-phenyl)propionate hydroxylase
VSSAADVVIVGAGPVGLTLANLLGSRGIRVLVVEARETLIDYPRGVGMDDESLRAFQAAGVIDQVLPHTTPDQWIIFVDGRRRELAKFAATTRELGWPRRSGFIQPLVDRVLLEGLERFPHVEVRFATTLAGFTDDGDGVHVRLLDAHGKPVEVEASYLVGADGGRSAVRKELGVAFDGISSSTRWLVVDVANDPIGTPNSYVGCDPRRPYVSSGLPHGIRRFEFMLFDGEDDAVFERERAGQLIRAFIPTGEIDVVRARVYTHHARVAASFARGRVVLAGDAAHLMPPWQGQGYNTGIRDALNLAWKLALIVSGKARPELLDTYDAERRPHATAMVRLSDLTGRFLSPTDARVAAARDTAVRALGLIPPLRDYILQMRFRPKPRYTAATVVGVDDDPAVGALFPQPQVVMPGHPDGVLLDEALGPWLSVVRWGVDPRRALGPAELAVLRGLGARFVTVLPMTQYVADAGESPAADAEHVVVGDRDAALRGWFNDHPIPMLFIRPDRVVAAGCQPMDAPATVHRLAERLTLVDPVGAPAAGAAGR